jgi:hypothetical protein
MVFVDIYLREEEKKLFPKDEYDEAVAAIYRRRHPMLASLIITVKSIRSSFVVSNFLWLIGTFGVALLITYFPVGVVTFCLRGLIYFSLLIIALPIFPAGLIYFISRVSYNSNYWTISIIIGWFTYILILLLGSFTKKRSAFVLLYLAFTILLIMNIIGSIQSATPICLDC